MLYIIKQKIHVYIVNTFNNTMSKLKTKNKWTLNIANKVTKFHKYIIYIKDI